MENNTDKNFDNLSIEEKENVIQLKKNKFYRRLIASGIIAVIIVFATPIALQIRKDYITNRLRYIENPSKDSISPVVVETPAVIQQHYENTTLQIALDYPSDTMLSDNFNSEKGEGHVEVYYPKESYLESVNGYKISITVFTTRVRTLQQFAETRLTGMKETCPSSSSFSEIEEKNLNGSNALYFEANYCSGYFRNYYIDYGNKYFEVSKYFKGDVGYRERYDTLSEEILETITFLPQRFDVSEFTKSILDTDTGVKFEYPSYLSTNCNLYLPSDSKYRTILSMCNDSNKEDGVIVGILTGEKNSETPSEMVEIEKNKMIDDYIAAKGVSPDLKEENVDFGGRSALKVSNLSWRGFTYIFVDLNQKSRNGGAVIAIVGYKVEQDPMLTTVNNIIGSFKFTK